MQVYCLLYVFLNVFVPEVKRRPKRSEKDVVYRKNSSITNAAHNAFRFIAMAIYLFTSSVGQFLVKE